ncbi:uncharacterized protein B0T15DRAFT_537571 [Chaetomium strumarium]|uniref:Pathogen-related protein n=1 Tax=Chaetomium strumarium TaxID=1170767 RepID=A0AAJ0GRF4_9PEZI|nr:hypothetical protein B0T15DRAFT_537571 [Chaetomium strumarium]
MATVEAQNAAAEAPAPVLPDYVLDEDAVLKDTDVRWRYGRAPDYSKTRKMYSETKRCSHQAGSLPDLVEKLVKNWEIEASHKTDLADWRTIESPSSYTFSVNGGPPQTAEHMLTVGTYNAVIGSGNEYYCPMRSSFDDSHKTFKRMMPSFAWEVLEVYSGPPKVAFRWRHWGVMKEDYTGVNSKGEKVTIKAHGGPIEIEGVTVGEVNDQLQLRKVDVFFDPMQLFRQMVPDGEMGVIKRTVDA